MIKPVENSLASNLVTRISDEVRDKTSCNKILCTRKTVEKVVICTFTQEHYEFQRKKGKTYFSAASAILFVWVTNGLILPRGNGLVSSETGYNFVIHKTQYLLGQDLYVYQT
jgi:hypothetical protein